MTQFNAETCRALWRSLFVIVSLFFACTAMSQTLGDAARTARQEKQNKQPKAPVKEPEKSSANDNQQQSQSTVADAARRSRQEKLNNNAANSKKVLTEDELHGENKQKVAASICMVMPCGSLTADVPSNAWRVTAWGTGPPTYVVPLEKTSVRIVLGPVFRSSYGPEESLNSARDEFFQSSLKQIIGIAGKSATEEDTSIEGQPARLVDFTAQTTLEAKHGTALFIFAPPHVMTVFCVYLKSDFDKGSPMCEDVINSLHLNVPIKYRASSD